MSIDERDHAQAKAPYRLPEGGRQRRFDWIRRRFARASQETDIYVPKQRIPMHTGNNGPANLLKMAAGGLATAGAAIIYELPNKTLSAMAKTGTITTQQLAHVAVLLILAVVVVACAVFVLRELQLGKTKIRLGSFAAAALASTLLLYGLRLIFKA